MGERKSNETEQGLASTRKEHSDLRIGNRHGLDLALPPIPHGFATVDTSLAEEVNDAFDITLESLFASCKLYTHESSEQVPLQTQVADHTVPECSPQARFPACASCYLEFEARLRTYAR